MRLYVLFKLHSLIVILCFISYIYLRQYENNLAVEFYMTGEKNCCVQIKIYFSKIMVSFVMSFPT